MRHNIYPGGVWRRPPPQPTSPRGPLPCAVRPHARISPGGQAPGGCAHPWRRSAAHSGLLGSILIHSGACSRGKAKTRDSQAASTADRTAWGRHKRMRCARSDSAHWARPGGLCAPGCALAAPQRGAQRAPRTDIGTLMRLPPGARPKHGLGGGEHSGSHSMGHAHKRMPRACSDSVRRGRPGGLCALAAPPTAVQRSPHAGLGTLATCPRDKATKRVSNWGKRSRSHRTAHAQAHSARTLGFRPMGTPREAVRTRGAAHCCTAVSSRRSWYIGAPAPGGKA